MIPKETITRMRLKLNRGLLSGKLGSLLLCILLIDSTGGSILYRGLDTLISVVIVHLDIKLFLLAS